MVVLRQSSDVRACIRMMLLPILRFAMRHAIRTQELSEDIKAVLVEAASKELAAAKEKVNVSRISVMTGLQRREVMRFMKEPTPRAEVLSIPARVLGQWEQDPRFLSKQKRPRMLKINDHENEFKTLIECISSDLNYGTVLFELQRIGAVEVHDRGVSMVRSSIVDRGDKQRGFQLLAQDVADIISAVESNSRQSEERPHLHARTEYDNIDPQSATEIKQWLLDEGKKLHEKVREYLSKFDRDVNLALPRPVEKAPRTKVSFVTFSLTKDTDSSI